MIGWLSGKILEVRETRLLLDTGGVGYEIQIPSGFSSQGLAPGQALELYIYTHVREDSLTLFGFQTQQEREVFLQLLSVSGVGAKTALHILSAIPSPSLCQAIQRRDIDFLRKTPGIGKKTAERLITELADKVLPFSDSLEKFKPLGSPSSSLQKDVLSALLHLGYRRSEAESVLHQMEFPPSASFDFILKETLKMLVK